MLQILQTNHIENYIHLIDELGLFDSFPNVVEAVDNDDVIGFGVYHFENQTVILDKIESDSDLYLYDGIVRAILYLAMMKGVNTAKFDFSDLDNVKKLGFVQNNDNILSDINGYMSKCKSCEK